MASPEGRSRELELLLACAHVLPASVPSARIEALLEQPLDWSRLLQLADRHGMTPLVAHHLRSQGERVPPKEQERFGQLALRNASAILMRTRELLDLLELFRGAGILAVPYKGPVLALQVYGNLALRRSGDLDILIRKADIPAARELLVANGYRHNRELSPAKTEFRLAARYCEDFFSRRGTHVEVHWAFTNKDVTFPLSLDDMAPRLGSVSLGSVEVPVFSPEDLLLILAAHGSKHRWDRLEWICGVSELLRRMPLDWRTVQERARSLGNTRTMLLAVLIAHDLLGAPVPEVILRKARSDRWIGRLALDVEKRLDLLRVQPDDVGEVLSQNLFELPLQERKRDRLRFLLYRFTTPSSPDHWQTLSVGRWSIHLHTLTWPLRLGGKLIRRPFSMLFRRGARSVRAGTP